MIRLILCLCVASTIPAWAADQDGPPAPSGYPRCVVSVDHLLNVYRTPVWGANGRSTTWVIARDGEVVLKRAAKYELFYKPPKDVPGNYSVHVTQFIDGAYRVISNIVYFRIDPATPLPELAADDEKLECTLFVGHNNRVTRSILADEETARRIVWVVRYNGRLVLKRNAVNSVQIRYFRNLPGQYEVELYRAVGDEQRLISNTVKYSIP